MVSTPVSTCPNCGAEFGAQFCGACGQRQIGPDDYSLPHFLKHAMHHIAHFDTKIFRTVIPLLFRPGFLTAEFLAGRRQRYVQPVTLFVLLNVAFFLIEYRLGLFNWELGAYLRNLRWLFQGLIDQKLATEGITLAVFAEQFNAVARELQRTMFFFSIPVLGLVLTPFFLKRYFVEHLIYSIHFHAYFLFFCLVGLPLLAGALSLFGAPALRDFFSRDPGLIVPILAGIASYHCIAIRKVYDTTRRASLIIGVVLTLAEPLIWLYVFRPLSFLVAFLAI